MPRPCQMFRRPVSRTAQLLWRATICPEISGSCGKFLVCSGQLLVRKRCKSRLKHRIIASEFVYYSLICGETNSDLKRSLTSRQQARLDVTTEPVRIKKKWITAQFNVCHFALCRSQTPVEKMGHSCVIDCLNTLAWTKNRKIAKMLSVLAFANLSV